MRTEQAAAVLGRSRLFGGLDEATLNELAKEAVERAFEKGQFLFHQGDIGESLFVMTEGLAKVLVTSERGDEMVLVTLRPGDTFGELALLDGGARSASAEALEPTTVLSLNRPTFLALLAKHPSLRETLLTSLGRVVRRLTEHAADLVFLDLHGRVAKLLVTLAEERGEKHDGAIVLDLDVTQSDLAHMVGGSRQSVNQVLHWFQGRGYLEISGRRILVARLDALRRRASL
jgi:CRP/FNR family transcriptional regulator, cyclic AMP receptor protein